METLLPSEVARLIYGYLEGQKCTVAAQSFLETCPLLAECLAAQRKGRKIVSRVHGQSLQEIIDDYCDTHCSIVERESDLNEDVQAEIEKSTKLNTRVQYLLNAACNIKEPTVQPNPPENDAQQNQSIEPSSSLVVTTPEEATPSHQETITESNVPVIDVQPINPSLTPVLPDEVQEKVQEEPPKVTTPKPPPVLTLSNTSPYRKKSPVKKRRGTPLKNASTEYNETEELLIADYIPHAAFMEPILKNTELHQKIAETINRVMGASNSNEINRPVERENPDEVLVELDAAIHSVVEQTQADPIFERLMDEMFSDHAEPQGSSETDDQTPSSSDRQVSSDGEDREESVTTQPSESVDTAEQPPKSPPPPPPPLVLIPPTPQHPSVLTFPQTPLNASIPNYIDGEADTSKELNTPNHNQATVKLTPSASQDKKQSAKKSSDSKSEQPPKKDEPPLKARLRSSTKKLNSSDTELKTASEPESIEDHVTQDSCDVDMTEVEPEQNLDVQNEAAIRCIVDATPVSLPVQVPIQDQCYVISTDVCVEMPSEVQAALSNNNMILQQSNSRKDIIELAMANSALCETSNQIIPVTSYSNTTFSAPVQVLQNVQPNINTFVQPNVNTFVQPNVNTFVQPNTVVQSNTLVPPKIFLPEHRSLFMAPSVVVPQIPQVPVLAAKQPPHPPVQQQKNRLVSIAPKPTAEDAAEAIYLRSIKRKPARSSKARARCVRPPPDRNIQSKGPPRQKPTHPPGQLINVGGPANSVSTEIAVATVGSLLPPVLSSPANKFFNHSMPSISPLLPPQPPVQQVVESPPKELEVIPEEENIPLETIAPDPVVPRNQNSGPKPTISPTLRQLTVNRTLHNPRRKSLSTPRRDRGHIRTLDFSTPPRGSSSLRKSNTSPKGRTLGGDQTLPRLSPGTTRKLSRAAKMVRTGLFLSPTCTDNQTPTADQDANISPVKDTTEVTKLTEQTEESITPETTLIVEGDTSLVVENDNSDLSISSDKIASIENALSQQQSPDFVSPQLPTIATRAPGEHRTTRSCWDKVAGMDLILGLPHTPQSPSPVRASPSPVCSSPVKKTSGQDWDSDWRNLIAQAVESPVKISKPVAKKRPRQTNKSKNEQKTTTEVLSSGDDFEFPKRKRKIIKKTQTKRNIKKSDKKKSAELVFGSSSGDDSDSDTADKINKPVDIVSPSISETPEHNQTADESLTPPSRSVEKSPGSKVSTPKLSDSSDMSSPEKSNTPLHKTIPEISYTPPAKNNKTPEISNTLPAKSPEISYTPPSKNTAISSTPPSKTPLTPEISYTPPPKRTETSAEISYTPPVPAPTIIINQTTASKRVIQSPRVVAKHTVLRNEIHGDPKIKSPTKRAINMARLSTTASSSSYVTPRKVEEENIQPGPQEETPLTKLLREQSNDDLELTVIDTPVFPITPNCILPPTQCASPPSPPDSNYFPPPKERISSTPPRVATPPPESIGSCVTVTTERSTRSNKTKSKPDETSSIQNLLAAAQNRMGLKKTTKNKQTKSSTKNNNKKKSSGKKSTDESMSTDNSLITDNLENIPNQNSDPTPILKDTPEMTINVAREELATSKELQENELKLREDLEEKRLRMLGHIKRDFSKKDLPVVNLQKTHQLLRNRNKSKRGKSQTVKKTNQNKKQHNTSNTSSSAFDDSLEGTNKNVEPSKKSISPVKIQETVPVPNSETVEEIVQNIPMKIVTPPASQKSKNLENVPVPTTNLETAAEVVQNIPKKIVTPPASQNAKNSETIAEVVQEKNIPNKIVTQPATQKAKNSENVPVQAKNSETVPTKNLESVAEIVQNIPKKIVTPPAQQKTKNQETVPVQAKNSETVQVPTKNLETFGEVVKEKNIPKKIVTPPAQQKTKNSENVPVQAKDSETVAEVVQEKNIPKKIVSPQKKRTRKQQPMSKATVEKPQKTIIEKSQEIIIEKPEETQKESPLKETQAVVVENNSSPQIVSPEKPTTNKSPNKYSPRKNISVDEIADRLRGVIGSSDEEEMPPLIYDDGEICNEKTNEKEDHHNILEQLELNSNEKIVEVSQLPEQNLNENVTNQDTPEVVPEAVQEAVRVKEQPPIIEQIKTKPTPKRNCLSLHMYHEKMNKFKHLVNERKHKRLKLYSDNNTKICISFSPIHEVFSYQSRSKPSSKYEDKSRYSRSSEFQKYKEVTLTKYSSSGEKVKSTGKEKKNSEPESTRSNKHAVSTTKRSQTPKKDSTTVEDDLMTYALVGSVRETSPDPPLSPAVQPPVESHTLPLKKRRGPPETSSSSAPTNKTPKVDNPQDMLRQVGLDNLLSVLHPSDNL